MQHTIKSQTTVFVFEPHEGPVLDDGMAMAPSGNAMETIEGMIAALQKLKAEITTGEKELPRNVGLIYLPHMKHDPNLATVTGDWGDAQHEKAWVKCSGCTVFFNADRSPDARSGKFFETRNACPSCGAEEHNTSDCPY